MKTIDSVNLTRKAFQEMTGLFNGNGRDILVDTAQDRWKLFGFVLQFLDGCILPATSRGTVLCFTMDEPKAISKQPTLDIDIVYVNISKKVDSESDLLSFINNAVNKYNHADCIYFESFPIVNGVQYNCSTLMELLRSIWNRIPVIYPRKEIKNVRDSLDYSFSKNKADIIVNLRGSIVDILKAPSTLTDFQFMHSCLSWTELGYSQELFHS